MTLSLPLKFRVGNQTVGAEALAGRYLGNQDHGRRIQQIVDLVALYKSGHRSPGGASQRRKTSQSAHTHAKALAKQLREIDLRSLIGDQLIEPADGPTPATSTGAGQTTNAPLPPVELSTTPLRITEIADFFDTLGRIKLRLKILADGSQVRRGRPPTADPLLLGMEQLADLWLACGTSPLTTSQKDGTFGDFALIVLRAPPLEYPAEAIETALNEVVSQLRPRNATPGPTAGEN